MIELILAIIIIAISVATIPTIVSQTTKSTSYALQQEAIMDAKLQMAVVLQTPWDSNLKNDTSYSPILKTSSPDKALNERFGLVHSNSGSRTFKSDTRMATNISGTSSPLAIDEFDGFKTSITPIDAAQVVASDKRYLNGDITIPVDLTTRVGYVSDIPIASSYENSPEIKFIFGKDFLQAPTSNVKHISVKAAIVYKVKDDDREDYTILHAYSANIGESRIRTRIF